MAGGDGRAAWLGIERLRVEHADGQRVVDEYLAGGRLHVGGFSTGPTAFAVNSAGAVPFAVKGYADGFQGYNLIVIVTFLAYSFVAPYDQQLALYIIAIGNPAGVFIQMAIQLPALKRNGIRIRPRVNLRDPALRETLGIGVPAVLVMLCSFAIVSVQNAASYNFADNGPSILAYARLWFTFENAWIDFTVALPPPPPVQSDWALFLDVDG